MTFKSKASEEVRNDFAIEEGLWLVTRLCDFIYMYYVLISALTYQC